MKHQERLSVCLGIRTEGQLLSDVALRLSPFCFCPCHVPAQNTWGNDQETAVSTLEVGQQRELLLTCPKTQEARSDIEDRLSPRSQSTPRSSADPRYVPFPPGTAGPERSQSIVCVSSFKYHQVLRGSCCTAHFGAEDTEVQRGLKPF